MARKSQKSLEQIQKLQTVASLAKDVGGAEMNEELTARLNQALTKILEDLDHDVVSAEQVKEHFAAIAKQAKAERDAMQANCRHVKEKGETALGGQKIGEGANTQVCLVCSRCQKDFFYPAREGQDAPPAHLIPDANLIGGRIN